VSTERLAEAVHRRSGILVGPARTRALLEAAGRVSPGLGAGELAAAIEQTGRGAALLDRLVDEMTVNETFFFRHRGDLDPIDWHGLAARAAAAGRGHVQVWSAACSSGEEAYTLAMLAAEAFGSEAPPVRVLGTDISDTALAGARRAEYGERAVRLVPAELRERWLRRDGRRHVVRPALRALVELRRHNLVQDPLPEPGPGRFDLVVCRNVLIYFDEVTVRGVVSSLRRALARSGELVLGTADRLSAWDGALPQPVPGPRPVRPATRITPRPAPPPRPAGPVPAPEGAPSLAAALRAADEDRLDEAAAAADAVLENDGLDPSAHFVRGTVELARDRPQEAVESLRRALYLDPGLAMAAFKLGRAHDALGRGAPARRAYAQALRALEAAVPDGADISDELEVADMKVACCARLEALAPAARKVTA